MDMNLVGVVVPSEGNLTLFIEKVEDGVWYTVSSVPSQPVAGTRTQVAPYFGWWDYTTTKSYLVDDTSIDMDDIYYIPTGEVYKIREEIDKYYLSLLTN